MTLTSWKKKLGVLILTILLTQGLRLHKKGRFFTMLYLIVFLRLQFQKKSFKGNVFSFSISVCKNGPDKDVVLRGLNPTSITEEFNEQLAGCTVIEGSLIISLGEDAIDGMNQTQEQEFYDMSFPELREVTDYVLLYQTNKIKTLTHLFPNLAVIRGNHLFKVSERFAIAFFG